MKRAHAIETSVSLIADDMASPLRLTITTEEAEEADVEEDYVRVDATSASESGYEVRVGKHGVMK